MCGIIGVIGIKNPFSEQLLKTIKHRGPDSQGWFEDDRVFLGHTRLAIQDVSANGNQPMYSEDGRYIIIFNGEIYNHTQIREGLKDSFSFKSLCDTETVLYAYIKYGQSFLDKLNGIFAFAIYDRKKEEIFLARDQLGVKPLYYYQDGEKFLFASEIKSITCFDIDKTISIKALANYVTFLWSPGSFTPFEMVKKLRSGCYLNFNVDQHFLVQPVKYYQIPFSGSYSGADEKELIDLLEKKLIDTVQKQMLSDVPLGFFLSGGLDSSLLVAIAKKLHPDKRLECFTIDTGELGESEGFADDLPYARKVADHLKVNLHILKADIDIIRDFDKMIYHLDEPQADLAPLHVLNICRQARERGIKVLIGGVGADDVFSGYRRHQALSLEKYFGWIPDGLSNTLARMTNMLPANRPFFRRIKKLFKSIDESSIVRMASYFEWIDYNELKKLFDPAHAEKLCDTEPIWQLFALNNEIPFEKNKLNQMLYWELNSFLVDHNLNYTDKMSMATGVEVRVPYLDTDLVAFAASIPPGMKMRGTTTKYLLRKVAEKYLPMEVIHRPKTGFGAPVRNWITSYLQPMINERLAPEKITERGIFNAEEVWKLIDDNKSGKIDGSYAILSLLAIDSWMNQFVPAQTVESKLPDSALI